MRGHVVLILVAVRNVAQPLLMVFGWICLRSMADGVEIQTVFNPNKLFGYPPAVLANLIQCKSLYLAEKWEMPCTTWQSNTFIQNLPRHVYVNAR